MIFIILGTQKFQFDRLLKEIDKLIEDGVIKEDVFAQIGYSTYTPKNYKFEKFLDSKVFQKKVEESELVIAHGGTGAIISGLQKNKKVIAVPRLAIFGEHVDDHQKEISGVMLSKGYIEVIEDISKLGVSITEVKNKNFTKYKSNNKNIINCIDEFIQKI